jgi:hypothetical protein
MTEAERGGFARDVAAWMPWSTIDYVRLNISAPREQLERRILR